jgi:DNA topoisomerase I
MKQHPKSLCARFGLNYVKASTLDICRRRCGKGFRYLDAQGKFILDEGLKKRFKRLAIPPAWTDVCIAADERAHIQAIGRDSEGRLQHRYHPEWEKARAAIKWQRLERLGTALPKVRNVVRKALSMRGLTRTKVIAAIVRLIDRTLLRPGYEEYARREGGRGASTLLKDDVVVKGDTLVFDFRGKGNKDIQCKVTDPLLARVIRKLMTLTGKRLFDLPDANGGKHPITARDVNEFLAEASGAEVTAKDFRTFKASATALAILVEQGSNDSARLQDKAIAAPRLLRKTSAPSRPRLLR